MASRKEYEMLFQLNAQLGGSYNSTFSSAQKALVSMQNEIEALNKTQSDISAYQKQQGAVEATEKKLKTLQEQYDNIQKEIQETEGFSSTLENRLLSKQQQIDKTSASLDQQTQKLGQMGSALNAAGVDTDNLAQESARLGDQVNQLKIEEEEAADQANNFGSSASQAFGVIQQAIAAAGIAAALKEIYEYFTSCIDASVEFESAMTGVAKTTELTDAELAAMAEEVKTLSTEIPITTTELANVAEVAGQLGIAKDDLLDFSTVMSMLGTATTMTADDAATLLAQMASITQMDPSYYSNLASAIVDLGNNYSTTEQKITDMAQGIAASANLAGMSEADMVALAAAVTSLGFEAGMGSTAISKLITEIQTAVDSGEDLELWASVAGVSARDFAAAWGNDAVSALEAFIVGLGNTEASGGSLTLTLAELGITEARMSNVIKALATSGDRLSSTLATANSAWEENTALVNEAEKRYGTTESKLVMMQNAYNNLKIAIGDALTPALAGMAEGLGDVAEKASAWVKDNPELVRAVTSAVTAFGALAAGILGVAAAIKVLKALDLGAMLATPFGQIALAISAVVTVGTGLISLFGDMAAKATEPVREMEALRDAAAKTRQTFAEWKIDFADKVQNVDDLVATIVSLSDAEGRSASDTEILKVAIAELNQIAPDLGAAFDEATGSVNMTADALIAAAEAAAKQEDAQGYAKRYVELQKERKTAAEDFRKSADALKEAEDALAQVKAQPGVEFSTLAPYIDAVNTAREANEGYNARLCSVNRDIRETEGALKDLTGETEDAADANGELSGSLQTLIDIAPEYAEAIYEAYNKAFEAAYDSLMGQVSLTEKWEGATKTSVNSIVANLDSYTSAFSTYNENLKTALENGLDPAVAEQFFSTMTTESAGALAAIAGGGEDAAARVNEAYGGVVDEVGSLSNTIGTVSGEFLGEIDKMMADAGVAGEDGAKELVSIIATTIIENGGVLTDADTETITNSLKEAQAATGDDASAVGTAIDDMMASGVYSGAGALYAAVTSVVGTAIARAQAAANASGGTGDGSSLGGYATGTLSAMPGLALVGERGPELINFGGGEVVYTADETSRILEAYNAANAEDAQVIALAPQLMSYVSALSGGTGAISAESGGSGRGDIVINFSPRYDLPGVSNASSLETVLREHDEKLKDYILEVMDEAGIDAARRAYK